MGVAAMSEVNVKIRQASLTDLAAIEDLAQELNFLHHQAWPKLFVSTASPSIDTQHWRDSISASGRVAFMAEKSGVPLGFITAMVVDEKHSLLQPIRTAKIYSVCVVPSWRGRGLGTLLMAAAESWAMGQGAVDMQLMVWAFNENAFRLYEELGYVVRAHTMGKSLRC